MTDTDLVERRLSDALVRAHDDDRWSGAGWPDPVDRVRAGARAARRRSALAAVTAAVVVGAVGVVAATSLTGAPDRVRLGTADGGGGSATGLGWLLTPQQYDAYTAAHPEPSASPDIVASPAAADAALTRLRDDAAAALPAGTRTVRADAADGGRAGYDVVWFRLADGTPVAVSRERLGYPLEAGDPTGPAATREHFTDPAVWPSGTAYTVLTGAEIGYGFDAGTQWSGPTVWTVTGDGWSTSWTAPVGTDRLLRWAEAADGHFTAAG